MPARPQGRVAPTKVLLVACFGAFLAFLDATIVNVAFPSIRESFPEASIDNLSWVLNAYNIVFAAFLVVCGRLTDLIGRRRAYAGARPHGPCWPRVRWTWAPGTSLTSRHTPIPARMIRGHTTLDLDADQPSISARSRFGATCRYASRTTSATSPQSGSLSMRTPTQPRWPTYGGRK